MKDIEKRKWVCPQCGSNGFEHLDANKVKCRHCGTVINLSVELTEAVNDHLEIKDGGEVKISGGATVNVKGGLTIKGGTLVITGGKLVIGNPGNSETDQKSKKNKKIDKDKNENQ